MYAIISHNPAAAVRRYRVKTPAGTRSYRSFAAACTAARDAFAAADTGRWPTAAELAPRRCGNPLARVKSDTPAKTAQRVTPDTDCVKLARGVFRVKGKRGIVSVSRDITARGREAAERVFLANHGTRVDSVRSLSRRDPDATAARKRRGTAERSAKIRRQRSAAETRIARVADRRKRHDNI